MKRILYVGSACLLIISACSKDKVKTDGPAPVSNSKTSSILPKSVSLTKAQYEILVDAMKSKKSIDTLLLKFAKNNTPITQSNNNKLVTSSIDSSNDIEDVDSEDVIYVGGDATIYDSSDPYSYGATDFSFFDDTDPSYFGNAYTPIFTGVIKMDGFFPKRGNTIYVTLYYRFAPTGGAYTVPGMAAQSQIVVINPAGGGLVDQSTKQVAMNIYNFDKKQNPANGDSQGQIVETRTLSRTSEGKLKFTAQGVVVGGEVEAGVTIVSQKISYTLYQYVANFQIKTNALSTPTVTYTFAGSSYGVQSN
ncbi:hypothetical protein [Mucilaginibacter paludis]|nr:hypothetical protein [Mucilaginibacter paludis]